MNDCFIVVCLDEVGYVLATRQVFATRAEAERYAASVASSRQPLVVEGRFAQLRLPPTEYTTSPGPRNYLLDLTDVERHYASVFAWYLPNYGPAEAGRVADRSSAPLPAERSAEIRRLVLDASGWEDDDDG